MPGVTTAEPEGAFYAFPSVEGLLGREIGGATIPSAMDLAGVLLEEAKVAVVPGEAFGAPGYIRLSFALADDQLVEGLERISELIGG
jgi:aspartate/methionine/tyrosine aminotransferase